jgi:pyrimidine-specific ribonucleoside hydrolase
MRPLVIITDATEFGDDSIAITLLANARPPAPIKLIVATSGNVWAEEAARNVNFLLAKLQRDDIDICVGMPSLTFMEQRRAFLHNRVMRPAPLYSGALGREPPNPSDGIRVCDDLFQAIAAADRPDLLFLAPASAVASVVSAHTDFADHIGRIYLMGGSIKGGGNATAAAEFNFWFDPEAAETLLAANLPITLLPLDPTRDLCYPIGFQAELNPEYPAAEHVRDCLARRPSPPVGDEVLAAVVLDRSVVTRRRSIKIAVETSPGPRYGAVNLLPDNASRRAVDVIENVDHTLFWDLVRGNLARMQPESGLTCAERSCAK